MAGFRFDTFKGIRPRVRPRLLPPNESQTAEDLRLGSGALEPWSPTATEQAESTAGVQSIFRMRNDGSPLWLESTNDVDYAPGPVPDDTLERIYYTGETQPRMTYIGIVDGTAPLPDDYRYLGIPAPSSAPTLSGDALPSDIVSGTVESGGFDTPALKADFTIEDNLPATVGVNSWYMGDSAGYVSGGTVRSMQFDFFVGKEMRVASVVDSNNITLEDANGGAYLAAGTDDERVNSQTGITKFRTDDTGTGRDGYFRFYLPNGTQVNIDSHGLQEGDVIRVSSVSQPVALILTQPGSVTSGGGMFFGFESDYPGGDPDVYTWPTAPVSLADDGFYISGARSYPFVDVYVDTDGAGSSSSFTINGAFDYELIRRGGEGYDDIATDIESRVYVFTYVSNLGEEGPPSPASDVVTIPTDGSVEVTQAGSAPATQRDIDNWRVYRANTGNEVTDFQFVAEVAIGTTTYDDSTIDSDLGEILQTESWEPPPTGLTGIIALPNGVLAGFVGKTVWFSEPYFPHAWPPEYKQAVEHDVVGLGVLPNGVAVLTKGSPYALVGDHPRGMSLQHFEFSQSCTNKRSIVNTLDSVLYASPDGLCEIGSRGFAVVTRNLMTKREWQDHNPDEVIGAWHDGKYFGFHSAGGFVFDPRDESIGFTTLSNATYGSIEAVYVDAEADALYVLNDDTIEQFDATPDDYTSAGSFTWKSGILKAPYPMNLGAARVVAASYPVTLNIWNDEGDLVVTDRSVTSDEVIRLPGGYLSDWFEIQVEGDDVVEVVHVAETVEELFEG